MNRRRQPHTLLRRDALRAASLLLLFSLLSSCAAPTQPAPQFPTFIMVTRDPNASPTPTPFQPSGQMDTPVPSFTPDAPASITATFTLPPPTWTSLPPTSIPPPVTTSAPPPARSARTNYILYATLDFEAH